MKLPEKDTIYRLLLVLGFYLLAPAIVFTLAETQLGWEALKGALVMLLVIGFPLFTLAIALWDGVLKSFGWWWIIAPPLLFLPSVFIFYNSSALIYCGFVMVGGILGSAVGLLFRKTKQ